MRSHRAFGASICCLAALLASVDAWGQTTPQAPTTPYTTVTVEFGSGIIQNTLPFDVPFIMAGTIDAAVTDVLIEYTRLPPNLAEKMGEVAATCTGVTEWRTAGTWKRVVSTTDRFTVLVPRLDVNQFYCFRFNMDRAMTPAELETFKAAARDEIDKALRQVPRASMRANQVLELRNNLIRRLERVAGPGLRVNRTSGSIWDPALDGDANAAFSAFIDFLVPILNGQQRIGPAMAGLRKSGTDAQAKIEEWEKTKAVRTVASALLSAESAGTALNSIVTTHRDVLTAASSGVLDLRLDLTIDQPWFPNELDALIDALEAALQRIGELEATYAQVAGNTALLKSAGLTTETVTTAIGQMADVGNSLRAALAEANRAQRAAAARQAAIALAAEQLGNSVRQNVDMTGTTNGAFATRHQWYIGLDLGFATAPQIESVSPYLGTNIYLRPVNKEAPLSVFGSFWRSFTDRQAFLRRFAVMVGLTNSGKFDKDGQREALFGNNALLTGAGYRVTDSFRASGGVIVLRGFDPNPNIDRKTLQITPFFSVSIDWDVRGTFTNERTP